MSIYTSRITILLAVLTPLVALPSRHGSTVVFYLFVALAAVALIQQRGRPGPPNLQEGSKLIAIALLAPLVSLLITSAVIGEISGSEFEKSLRFALAIPILWLLGRVPGARLRHVQWGLIGASLSGALMLIGIFEWLDLDRGAVVDFGGSYNAVTFANLTLLFGLMSLLTLPWTLSPWPRAEAGLKVAVALLCAYATVLSETRSSWMIVPVFLLIALVTTRTLSRRVRLACVLGGMALIVATGVLVGELNPRVAHIIPELQQFAEGGPRDTSIGIRLQLWEASLIIFRDHPWVGIGAANFRDALHELMTQGVVTPLVASEYGEPHNDLLAALSCYGVVGLLAMGALYGLPALVFYGKSYSASPRVRVAARLGLLLCLGYTAFSLTEMMFRNMRSVPIYSTLLVILFALTADGEANAPHDAPRPDQRMA